MGPPKSKPSAPSRAPALTTGQKGTQTTKRGGGKYQLLDFSGLENNLKLRTKLPITDQLSAEVGADYNVTRQDAEPRAALFYEIRRGYEEFATLRVSTERVQIRKPFSLQREKWGLRVYATAGTTLAGAPEVGVDVDSVRPGWLLAIPAVILLLAGKPLGGSQSFGNLRARLPLVSDDAVFRAEGAGKVTKKGNFLQLGVSQVNAVLRL